MLEEKRYTLYNKRTWLNPEDSPYTGSVVCYDSVVKNENGNDRNMFIEIGSCHEKARLHKAPGESPKTFINKLIKLRDQIDQFIEFLEQPYIKYKQHSRTGLYPDAELYLRQIPNSEYLYSEHGDLYSSNSATDYIPCQIEQPKNKKSAIEHPKEEINEKSSDNQIIIDSSDILSLISKIAQQD